jgi:uncharacterized protein YgiM (DUF1202 family)
MRRWKGASRWGTAVLAVCLMAAAAGCGQLFSVAGSSSGTSSTDQQSLAQRVTQLEATVSELQAAVAGLSGGQGSSVAATSSGASGGAQAMVTASYLNVRQSPDTTSMRVGVLKQDTVVSVLAQSGNWSQIKYGPVTGWVDSQWLTTPGTSTGSTGTGTSTGTSSTGTGSGGSGSGSSSGGSSSGSSGSSSGTGSGK